MIHFLYTKFDNQLDSNSFNSYLRQLPISIQNKILKFRKWEDAHRSLFGNILLLQGLKILKATHHSLGNLKYTEFQKPYFDGGPHFNVSHSGAYVICAIGRDAKLGVDIELIKDIVIADLSSNFSREEWTAILESPDTRREFYSHWTQKESFLKAVGIGISFPLEKIFFSNKIITWENESWFLHEILLDPEYVCHLVTNIPQPEIIINQIPLT
ncbi:MAG: 4'-phosphopantetheinyl transferase superfamily protein [Hymenobacter sp.]|nr:4'-phosphopantetheinyl transferase superfamily protein [Hymenobacter sp.]